MSDKPPAAFLSIKVFEQLACLTDAELGRCLRMAIAEIWEDRPPTFPQDGGFQRLAYGILHGDMAYYVSRYTSKCERNRANAKKRWERERYPKDYAERDYKDDDFSVDDPLSEP